MLDLEPDLTAECEAIWRATLAQKWDEQHLRDEPVIIRLLDGDMNLHHLMRNEYSANFAWVSNDSGPAQTEVPFDSPEGQWLYDMWGRMERGEKRNVHINARYCGAEWPGRLDKCVVDYRADGDIVVVCDWLHDYENVKWYTVWSNPWLPAAFQFPRAFLLAGPVTWLLKTALHLQLIREHNPLITIPDDPLDFASYLDVFDQSTWSVVVKPTTFMDAMNSGVVWGIISSRWANWHDMAHAQLEDAELSVVCHRYLQGDPEPWPGANLRYGTLWIDIVDKSGVHVGTSNGGTMFDGLARTVAEFADDFIDSTENLIEDTDQPEDYFLPNLRLTHKEHPYVTYRQVETGQHINSPAKGVQVNVGGHSMPGVNEAISASIQAGFDVLGGLAQIGSLGGSVDALVKPLYEDTILAWWSVKSTERAKKSGWSRYFEYFQDGANKAYTIASLMVLRAGFWATKTTISNKLTVIDGAPYLVGDNGLGHWFLDDRIAYVIPDDPTGRIWMDRARKIELKLNEDGSKEWVPTIGDERALQDPAQRAWGKIEQLVAGLRDLGVY